MYFQIKNTNVRVLGSIHSFPKDKPTMPYWTMEAYEWCESLIFESDETAIFPHIKAKAGDALADKLSHDLWSALQEFWPTSGVLSPLNDLKPWAVLLVASALNQKTSEGVESNFRQWAARDSKPLKYLETGQELAALFDSAPLEEVIQSLQIIVSDLSLAQRTLIEMHTAWHGRDGERLFAIVMESPSFRFPNLRRIALNERNKNWVSTIQSNLKTKQRTLIVVGALHLYGPGNLFELIQQDIELVV